MGVMIPKKVFYAAVVLFIVSSLSFAQGPAKLRKEEPPIPVDEIIQKFTQKEKEFRTARENYTYHQTVRVQNLNANDRVMGEYYVESDIIFDSAGKRTERITKAPPNTLQNIQLTPENLFPRFETYREQIDGLYWFPTYTRAVDTLRFSSGAQRIRQIIRYDNYKKFQTDVKLTFGDAVDGQRSEERRV